MHWHDFLHPGRALAAVAKLVGVALALLMVESVAIGALGSAEIDAGGIFAGLFVLTAVSVTAYVIREGRMKRRSAVRSTRGAERMPVMEGDE